MVGSLWLSAREPGGVPGGGADDAADGGLLVGVVAVVEGAGLADPAADVGQGEVEVPRRLLPALLQLVEGLEGGAAPDAGQAGEGVDELLEVGVEVGHRPVEVAGVPVHGVAGNRESGPHRLLLPG